MNRHRSWIVWWVGLALWMAAGCQSAPPAEMTVTASPSRSGVFTPYRTITPTRTATHPTTTPPSATPVPTETPTPRTYVVKAGDDMSGIALRYRVPLSELKTANPTVNPRLMLVGTILIIPGTAPAPTDAVKASPTSTPQPVVLEAPACTGDQAGGAWCFVGVRNQSDTTLINVTANFHLEDASGDEVSALSASLPLDLLPKGSSLPLSVYFPPPLPQSFQVLVELASALPASSVGDHYAQVTITGLKTNVGSDGLNASATGQVELAADQPEPTQLSVLLIAYAADGSVAGMRRWDSAHPPSAGKPAGFDLKVYSLGRPIERVEVFAEARK